MQKLPVLNCHCEAASRHRLTFVMAKKWLYVCCSVCCSATDPIYALATPFRANELKSANKKMLVQPSSYDRTVIESRWRQCRNRMRINRRPPLLTNDLSSRATKDNDSCTENGVVAHKKSRLDDSASEGFSENVVENVVATDCDTDKLADGSESVNNELTVRTCPDHNNVQSSNSVSNSSEAFELNDVSAGQPEHQDNSFQVATADTSQAVDAGLKREECWWNNVDSRTWLQGVQTYLLLHSAADVQTHRIPVAVLSPNITPYTVIGNSAICQQATTPVMMQSPAGNANSLQTQCQIVRPLVAPVAGYRVSANGVLSAVPICYFPVTNYSVCGLTSDASANGCQEAYIGGQRSSLAAVDLVSFMHNYCLPPTSTRESSVSLTAIQAGHNVAGHNSGLPSSAGAFTTGVTEIKELLMPAVPEQKENSHSGSWLVKSESHNSDAVGNLSTSSVHLTPGSMSSIGSGDCWANTAAVMTSRSSTVIVDSYESAESIEVKTSSLILENTDLTVPGWFGKGLNIRRSKRRMSRQS